jgi:hypothetical protein
MAASPNIVSTGSPMVFKQSESDAAERTWLFYLSNAADGTPATGKTIATTDFKISKNGAAFGNAGGTVTEMSLGWYKMVFTTGDIDTLGALACELSGEAGVDTLHVTHQIVALDMMAGAGVAVNAGGIVAASFGAGAITATVIADGAIDAATFAANAITAAVIADGAIDAATFAAGAIDAAAVATGAIDAAAIAADVTTELAGTLATQASVDALGQATRAETRSGTITTATGTVATSMLGALSCVVQTAGTFGGGTITLETTEDPAATVPLWTTTGDTATSDEVNTVDGPHVAIRARMSGATTPSVAVTFVLTFPK